MQLDISQVLCYLSWFVILFNSTHDYKHSSIDIVGWESCDICFGLVYVVLRCFSTALVVYHRSLHVLLSSRCVAYTNVNVVGWLDSKPRPADPPADTLTTRPTEWSCDMWSCKSLHQISAWYAIVITMTRKLLSRWIFDYVGFFHLVPTSLCVQLLRFTIPNQTIRLDDQSLQVRMPVSSKKLPIWLFDWKLGHISFKQLRYSSISKWRSV